MKYLDKVILIVLAAAAIVSGGTISVNSVQGAFVNPVDGTAVGISNGPVTSSIRWGTNMGSGQSGYDFTSLVPPAVNTTVPPTPSPWLLLGTFTHLNRPVLDSAISSVGLNVTVGMTVDAANITGIFGYGLVHNETANAVPCAAWQQSATPCDDRVTVNAPSSGVFSIGGVYYTLQLGFSKDGGATILDTFVTTEGLDNQANLYGRFTTDVPDTIVPEPGTFWILGLGIAALTCAKARRKH